ncbi:MAG: hypothetical protein SFY96_07370 [Planctomycetota bacterium]|nr:hypothetical protein [Planctomycetota bacterium]
MNKLRVSALMAVKSVVLAVVMAGGLPGCASDGATSGKDPLTELKKPTNPERYRAMQVAKAWNATEPGSAARAGTRKVFKDMLWSAGASGMVRVEIVKALLSDTDPEGIEDTRQMLRLMLPREADRTVVTEICKSAAERGWTDYVPAMIRSYSRAVPALKSEEDRAERIALKTLVPDKPVERIAYDVFLNPPASDKTSLPVDWAERTRVDAWDLLARLDSDGQLRAGLIEEGANDDELIVEMRAALRDLKTIPLTGEEIRWLKRLRNPKSAANQQWWQEASSAIAKLPRERYGLLRLRHAEPIRWAAAHKPEWLERSRDELLLMVKERVVPREHHYRTVRGEIPVSERIDDWGDKLKWGDLLALLVVDQALSEPTVVTRLFECSLLDRKDDTTEYGGVIRATDLAAASSAAGKPVPFVATLYPPRPGQRKNDRTFIASDDMLSASDSALLHFHLHVQKAFNSDYSGPSDGDLDYANRMGRSCLVFTSIDEVTMNVDYYQSNGAVIDLGEVKLTAK